MTGAYIVYGGELSYFTRKLEAGLIFYGIDYEIRAKTPDVRELVETRAGTNDRRSDRESAVRRGEGSRPPLAGRSGSGYRLRLIRVCGGRSSVTGDVLSPPRPVSESPALAAR